MNRRSLFAKTPFKLCQRERICIRTADLIETQMARRNSLNLPEVIELISGYMESSVRFQCMMDGVQKLRCHQPASVMPSLWPRIGKEEIKCFNHPFGKKITNGIGNFDI